MLVGRILYACLASLITFGLGATAAPLRLCLGSQPNSPLLLPLLVDWSPRFSQAPRASCLLAACCARFVRGLTVVRLVCSGRGVEWSGGIKWARVSFNRIAALWPVAFGSCVTAYLRSCYCVLLCTLLFALNEFEETRIIVTVHTIRETRQISHSKT